MVNATDLRVDLNGILSDGCKVRFRYFSISGANTGYDDEVTLTKSGNDYWTSGLIQPLDRRYGSNDSVLIEQGLLLSDDKRLYVNGEVPTSGTLKIGIGSPTIENEYSITQPGVITYELNNNIPVYKKIYVRRITTGSIIGE